MRVAILNLTRGGLSGGYRSYLRNLVPLLRDDPGIDDLLMVSPPGQEIAEVPGVETGTWQADEHRWGYPSVRARVKAWRPDVVFIPTARWIDCDAPCVSMVRNMEPMIERSFDAGLSVWLRRRAGEFVARRAAHRSARVIAVSGFVRDYIVTHWKIPADRIGVVPHGVAAAPARGDAPGLRDLADRPFLLAAGSLEPYRGLEDLVGALGHIPVSARPELVIAGEGPASYKERIVAMARTAGVADRIHWVGHLSPSELASAFSRCVAFVMSSRVEACPNTVLEAMAYGTPSISTTAAPMPEFFGDAALYYSPGNDQELASRIREILAASPAMRQAHRDRGLARATHFTWRTTARRTVDELRAAMDSTSR